MERIYRRRATYNLVPVSHIRQLGHRRRQVRKPEPRGSCSAPFSTRAGVVAAVSKLLRRRFSPVRRKIRRRRTMARRRRSERIAANCTATMHGLHQRNEFRRAIAARDNETHKPTRRETKPDDWTLQLAVQHLKKSKEQPRFVGTLSISPRHYQLARGSFFWVAEPDAPPRSPKPARGRNPLSKKN